MKKLLSLIALAFLPLYASAISIEADVSAFFPINSTIKKIYGGIWPDFAFTIDHIQPFRALKQLSFFGQIDYIFNKGHSLAFNQNTHIRLIPITVGLKWIQPLNNKTEIYLGVAPKYYFMHIKNNSSFVPRTSNRNDCGFSISIGSFIYPIKHLMINVFFSYSYIRFSAPSSTTAYRGFSTNLSGFNLGTGLGWKF